MELSAGEGWSSPLGRRLLIPVCLVVLRESPSPSAEIVLWPWGVWGQTLPRVQESLPDSWCRLDLCSGNTAASFMLQLR